MQQNIRISLENSTAIRCDACNNDTFTEVVYIRRISKLLTGSPEDMIAPMPAFACSKCGHINEQFKLKEPEKEEPKSHIIQPV
jgi:hypothetical protein